MAFLLCSGCEPCSCRDGQSRRRLDIGAGVRPHNELEEHRLPTGISGHLKAPVFDCRRLCLLSAWPPVDWRSRESLGSLTRRRKDTSMPATGERLDSWKEIAAHFNRDVTTVRRWERREGLPVHRHPHQSRSSVYAYRTELDAWWRDRSASRPGRVEHPTTES